MWHSSYYKKGASLRLIIRKCKLNQPRKLDMSIINQNSRDYSKNFCSVAELDSHLAARRKLTYFQI